MSFIHKYCPRYIRYLMLEQIIRSYNFPPSLILPGHCVKKRKLVPGGPTVPGVPQAELRNFSSFHKNCPIGLVSTPDHRCFRTLKWLLKLTVFDTNSCSCLKPSNCAYPRLVYCSPSISPSMLSLPAVLGSMMAIAAFGRLFTTFLWAWGMKFCAVGLK